MVDAGIGHFPYSGRATPELPRITLPNTEMPVTLEQTEIAQLLEPLRFFYERAGHAVPAIEFVAPEDVPQPAHSLLVHERDMTSTLRRFHESRIVLDVRSREVEGDQLLREVILRRESDRVPVEYGAISISLDKFSGPIRDKIINGDAPLGELIETYVVAYRSSPRGYFQVASDAVMAGALEVTEGSTLYGRSNELSDSDGIVFARVVEVLP